MTSFYESFLSSYHTLRIDSDRIAVAVSGGVDSMTLLFLLLQIREKKSLIVLHFDHMLRGDASDQDRILVEEYCQKYAIPHRIGRENIRAKAQETRHSLEMTARVERYAFFEEVCRTENIGVLLTAHHLDDRIETALFHLIRGTKLDGIHALLPESYHGTLRIVRPLLHTTKAEISGFAEENAITFHEDATNLDTEYQRNYLRHEVLPRFYTINPEYPRALGNFIQYTEEVSSFINTHVLEWLGHFPENTFSAWDFARETPFLQREIVRLLYQRKNNGTIGLGE